jgi:transposase
MAEFKISLDIPDIEILSSEVNEDNEIILTIQSTIGGVHCHRCGNWIEKIHSHEEPILIRHLSVLDNALYLEISLTRYECPYCDGGPTTTEKLSWRQGKSQLTKGYEQHLLLQIVNSTVEDVCIKEDMGYQAVLGIIDRQVETEVDWDEVVSLKELGLDEISLKKGHKNFVVIVTARADKKIILLGVLKDRKKETVKAFLSKIPLRLKKTLEVVCCDMYDGFMNAVKEDLGKKVKIVIDRFHVAKHYRSCLDTLRKKELRRLKRDLRTQDYKNLKGAMWALRKKPEKLTEEEKIVLARLFKRSPLLKTGYDFQMELTNIFDSLISRKQAQKQIKDWIERVKASEVREFNPFLQVLETMWEEILNYFTNRENSGFVEGLNNKIKTLKRRCYGIFNLRHLYQRIYIDLNGYEVFA